jgi:hypothetical protein
MVVACVACGSESIAPVTPAIHVVVATPAPKAQRCADDAKDRTGEWRYALVTEAFDPVEDITRGELADAWKRGAIAAAPETITALAPVLGDGEQVVRLAARPAPHRAQRAIVPAHELSPAWKLVTIDGAHPLVDPSPLVVPLCGGPPARNIDRAKLTTLVMSGTTALTRRTAERIDSHGARDVASAIAPWFSSADLTHVSNEVAFLRDCDPITGPTGEPDDLTFCAKDRYIEVLEEIGTDIVELTGSHLIDYGSNTLVRTIRMYRERGWQWFGGGLTQLASTEPLVVEHHGNRLAFIGCNAIGTWLHAISKGPGVGACDWPRMQWQIRDLRRRGLIPIVSVQHQETHVHDVPPALVTDLRRLAEAGAAFVLGSQAHSAHPWELHHGAYVHYGPGNILFHQYPEAQREASVDKLYFHAGTLLAVDHLYTRQEHGRPRLLTARERARFLGQMSTVLADLPPADPWAAPTTVPDDHRVRPDSLVVQHGRLQHLAIQVPEKLAADKTYPLVIDLTGTGERATDAFVVAPVGKLRATGPEIAGFIHTKYPVDPDRTSITPAPPKREKRRPRRR